VLTRISPVPARVAVGCLLAVMLVVLGVAAGPTAAAAPTGSAAGPGIPASAVNQLASETTAAWQISTGQGVTVALLDTAVDPLSDLAGRLTIGPDYAPLPGASAADGTVIASMIAGSGPTAADAFGAVGRAPGAQILAEQVYNDSNAPQEQHYESNGVWQGIVASAIRYAVNHGASVIVDTEYGGSNSTALQAAVAYALSKNVVVIGSSSAVSGDQQELLYPDSLPGVINFSGTTISGLPGPQSPELYPMNGSVLITAPDNELPATGPGDEPYVAWGYDSAVAWVAGTVALIKSVYPQLSPGLVIRALALSASYPPAGGYNTTVGFGLINPLGALHEAASLVKLRVTAAPGPAALTAGAHLDGTPPGIIHAVRHSIVKLVGYSAAVVVGIALLIVAAVLRRRPRSGTGPASPAPAGPPTDPPTDPPTVPPTDPPTVSPTDPPTVSPTDPPTVLPTDPPTGPRADPVADPVGG
jgi:hypothetical protein